MADKSSFTSEEWKLLLESVMMAGIAGHRGRAEWPLGSAQGELCERQRVEAGEDGPGVESAYQGSGRRL